MSKMAFKNYMYVRTYVMYFKVLLVTKAMHLCAKARLTTGGVYSYIPTHKLLTNNINCLTDNINCNINCLK